MTMTYQAETTHLDGGRVLRFTLLQNAAPLSWSSVIKLWQSESRFREFFIALLANAPFPAYFWETPPMTSETLDDEFEFVLVASHQLAGVSSDQCAFANQFARVAPDAAVIMFENLGGDAMLVVPCPGKPLSAYAQIATFAREAPCEQQHQLWALVGRTLEERVGENPVWVNTSGLGVYWLHIRLDDIPKYYTHEPYRLRRAKS